MTKADPPPIYDDLESGNYSSPYQASSSTWTSIRSDLSGPPSITHNYILMASMTPQKPSERMLALAASASTEPERIAAMQAVPQLLADEEKTRQAQVAEAAQKAAAEQKVSDERYNNLRPVIRTIVVILPFIGFIVGAFFFMMWIVTTPQWRGLEMFFVSIFLVLILGVVALFAALFIKKCLYNNEWC